MYVKPPAGYSIPAAMTQVSGPLFQIHIENACGMLVALPKFMEKIDSKV
jgi:hypothetical protein